MSRCVLSVSFVLAAIYSHGQERKLLDSLHYVYDHASHDTTKILVMEEIAKLRYRSVPDTAIAIGQDAVANSLKISFGKGIARGYNVIGLGYWMKSNHAEALTNYQKSLPYFENSNDLEGYGLALNNIGIIYHYQNDYPLALGYFEKALGIHQRIHSKVGMGLALNNLGLNYEAQGDQVKALGYYRQALALYEQIGSKIGIALSLTNLGYIYFSQGKYDDALEVLQRAAIIQEEVNDQSTLISSLIGIAQVYQKQKNYNESIQTAQRAYQLARSMNSLVDEREAVNVLYQIYKEQANPAKALTYFERYKELNDSVFTVESNRAIASMEGRLVLERKQKEIEGLENESALQKKINYLGLAIILSMVAFTYFMVRSRKKLLNAYAQLEETNNSLIEIKRKVEMQADLLGKSNKTKDKIFSIVSHDLRSPMTALKGLFGLIENGQLSIEEFKALIPDLTRRVSHASDIMDELLQWSRSQLEVMETHPEVIDVKAMLQRKVLEWHEPAADKGVNIQVGDIPQDLKAWADPDMVKTVVRNLISNAIKFCRRNDSITLTARQEANFAQITVEDTGVGILSENLHRILNEHGFSTYGTAQEKGTGIGLMLCKEFIEKNGGKIWVESIPGSRTKFLFTLPLPR